MSPEEKVTNEVPGGEETPSIFEEYLRDHEVTLKENISPDRFIDMSEKLSREASHITLAATGIFQSKSIAKQFESVAEHAAEIESILKASPFTREELAWLTPRSLLESWGRESFGNTDVSRQDEMQIECEWNRIREYFDAHPIHRVISSLVEVAKKAGQEARQDPQDRKRADTIRDEDISIRCADVFERLTEHRAALSSVQTGGGKQISGGRFRSFVHVVCDRIQQILRAEGHDLQRPHPSDATLRKIIKAQRS